MHNSTSVMKFYLLVFLSVLNIFPPGLISYSSGIFFKNSTIAHLETGLFLDYVGLYRPSDTVIHNSAIFPMTAGTCHFLPLSAAAKIPACNITTKRSKHFVSLLIGLGAGVVNFGLSVGNGIQIANLRKQIAIVEKSLSEFSQTMQIQEANLVKVQSNQIKIAEQLQVTQKALSDMLPILNSHSHALNTLKTGVERLHSHFQRSFLYLAISRIFRNQLTFRVFITR